MAVKTHDRCFAQGRTGPSPAAKMVLGCQVLAVSQGKQAVQTLTVAEGKTAHEKGVGLEGRFSRSTTAWGGSFAGRTMVLKRSQIHQRAKLSK